jgi:(2Fe-2S) ferredoxin
MERYAHHVIVCTGGFCTPDRRGRELYAHLARLLQREGLLFGPARVKRGETPCLGVCAQGPIVVVYPEGVWYARVTPGRARPYRRRTPQGGAAGRRGRVSPALTAPDAGVLA